MKLKSWKFIWTKMVPVEKNRYIEARCNAILALKKQTVMDIWNTLCRWRGQQQERRRSSWPLKLEGSQRRDGDSDGGSYAKMGGKKKKKGEKVSATQWQNTTTYGEFLLSHYYKSSTTGSKAREEMKWFWTIAWHKGSQICQ